METKKDCLKRTEEDALQIANTGPLDAAFPFKIKVPYGNKGDYIESYRHGLSKRELFSSMILQSIVSSSYDPIHGIGKDPSMFAKDAIKITDALLEELNKE